MRALGLDVGEKRIGVAVSDPLGITAQGAGVIKREEIKKDLDEIAKFIEEYKADSVVVGMPFNMNGTKGKSAEIVDEFVENLRAAIKVPVEIYDERLSTKEGERFLISSGVSRKKRKKVIDTIAAQLVLQSYLDRSKNPSNT